MYLGLQHETPVHIDELEASVVMGLGAYVPRQREFTAFTAQLPEGPGFRVAVERGEHGHRGRRLVRLDELVAVDVVPQREGDRGKHERHRLESAPDQLEFGRLAMALGAHRELVEQFGNGDRRTGARALGRGVSDPPGPAGHKQTDTGL